MGKIGQFDTDAPALLQRIKSHARYGSRNLEEWAFGFLGLTEGLKILELGCGTGQQTIPIAGRVGRNGHILGVDISQDALNTLLRQATSQGVNNRIDLLLAELDDFGANICGQQFDRALSCYAFYYARDPHSLMRVVNHALKPGGIFFFCGPSKDNNAELKQFHYALRGEKPPRDSGASEFMGELGQRLANEIFSRVSISTFENALRFESAEDLYLYWHSYNLYEPSLDSKFRTSAAEYFAGHQVFETVKRVIGVQAIK